MDVWNTTFLLGRPIFRGYVSCWYRPVVPVYFNTNHCFLTEQMLPMPRIATEWTASAHTSHMSAPC